jgi:hypothetical protein
MYFYPVIQEVIEGHHKAWKIVVIPNVWLFGRFRLKSSSRSPQDQRSGETSSSVTLNITFHPGISLRISLIVEGNVTLPSKVTFAVYRWFMSVS